MLHIADQIQKFWKMFVEGCVTIQTLLSASEKVISCRLQGTVNRGKNHDNHLYRQMSTTLDKWIRFHVCCVWGYRTSGKVEVHAIKKTDIMCMKGIPIHASGTCIHVWFTRLDTKATPMLYCDEGMWGIAKIIVGWRNFNAGES